MSNEKLTRIKLHWSNWIFLWIMGWWFTVGYGIGMDMAAGAKMSIATAVLGPLVCLPFWPLILGIMVALGGGT